MKTYELEEKIRAALIGNEDLIAVLPLGEKAIYHYVAPTVEPKRYPIIVYAPIVDVPALIGDDCEIVHRVTIEIYVIAMLKRFEADKQRFIAACDLLPNIMETLGFVRLKTTPTREDGKLTYVFEFVKNELC